MMANNLAGFLIISFALLVSTNIIMAMQGEALLLAWLNQILIGIIFIAVVSYVVVRLGTRKTVSKVGGKKADG